MTTLTPEQRRQKIVLGLKEFFADIETLAKETHGSQRVLDELDGDLDSEIAWEPFSKLPSEITNHITKIFQKEETAYTDAHFDEAKDWVREHRHTRKDRDNLAVVFRSAFARDADEVSINFHDDDFGIQISGSKRIFNGATGKISTIRNSRHLSDAEIVEVWEKETTK